jgi:hypothetical protein
MPGLTVDNARLHETEHAAAVTPQHSLLPVVPEVDGLQGAARYLDGLRDDVVLLAVRLEDRDARPAARPTWTAEVTGS